MSVLAASTVINVRPLVPARSTLDSGLINGWFYRQVQRIDPRLATSLHEASHQTPFTISPLQKDEGAGWWFRVSSVHTALSAWLTRLTPDALEPRIAFGGGVFAPVGVTSDPRENMWACAHWIDELWQALAAATDLEPSVRLTFHTPTGFAAAKTDRGGQKIGPRPNQLFPEPELVMNSLVRRWNRCAAEAITDEQRLALTERLFVEWFDLKPAEIIADRRREVGVTGYVDYSLGPQAPIELRRILHAVCGLAFYSGVGARRTMGMGQVTASIPPQSRRSGH